MKKSRFKILLCAALTVIMFLNFSFSVFASSDFSYDVRLINDGTNLRSEVAVTAYKPVKYITIDCKLNCQPKNFTYWTLVQSWSNQTTNQYIYDVKAFSPTLVGTYQTTVHIKIHYLDDTIVEKSVLSNKVNYP